MGRWYILSFLYLLHQELFAHLPLLLLVPVYDISLIPICIFDKYNLPSGQINFALWIDTFCNWDQYISHFHTKLSYFQTFTHLHFQFLISPPPAPVRGKMSPSSLHLSCTSPPSLPAPDLSWKLQVATNPKLRLSVRLMSRAKLSDWFAQKTTYSQEVSHGTPAKFDNLIIAQMNFHYDYKCVQLCRVTLPTRPTPLLPSQAAFSPPPPPSSIHSHPHSPSLHQPLLLLSPPPPPPQSPPHPPSLSPALPQLDQSSLELQLSHVSTNQPNSNS